MTEMVMEFSEEHRLLQIGLRRRMGCYGLGVPRCVDDDYNDDDGEGGINTQLNQYMVMCTTDATRTRR